VKLGSTCSAATSYLGVGTLGGSYGVNVSFLVPVPVQVRTNAGLLNEHIVNMPTHIVVCELSCILCPVSLSCILCPVSVPAQLIQHVIHTVSVKQLSQSLDLPGLCADRVPGKLSFSTFLSPSVARRPRKRISMPVLYHHPFVGMIMQRYGPRYQSTNRCGMPPKFNIILVT
jgi:hypothetical protein